ncbi:MAG: hypothetical protein GC151_07695 [Betaproteobacteria bacterium]|nr:hypothetical protein [Betaproteobacteria bacterium]
MLSVVLIGGCGLVGPKAPPPVGPHPLGDTYGQFYDLAKYEACVKVERRNTYCNRFRLRRVENPELWPYPDVPPMKWPDPPARSVYREGMTPVEYWRALCRAEAGEFIYRAVDDVDGLYQIRPRRHESEYAMVDRYVVEDPYGHTIGEEAPDLPFNYIAPKYMWPKDLPRYSFIESAPSDGASVVISPARDESLSQPPGAGERYQRFVGFDQKDYGSMRMTWVKSLRARFGFTWRGIRRAHDREMGIAGGELAVVDLDTNEILGLRRGFILGVPLSSGGVSWATGNACPDYMSIDGPGKRLKRNKYHNFGLWFLVKVARPSGRTYEE